MATKIILKKSNTVGAVPLSADLEIGEVALNLADRKLFTKDNGGNVRQVGAPYVSGTAPTAPVEGDLWYDATNDALNVYDGTDWQSAGYKNLSELEDVTITSIAAGEIIKWNGTQFVNNTLAEANIQAASSTTQDARDSVSAVDAGGDGSFSYNSTTGQFTYTGPSSTEVQAHFTAGTNTTYSAGTFDITDTTIRGKVSVTDNGGDGSLSYDNETGVITYTGPSDTEVRAHLSDGAGVAYNSTTGVISLDFTEFDTSDVVEDPSATTTSGTMYFTNPRAREAISVADNGGDGSLSYNNTTGVISYTGPSDTEVRAHLSGGTGVTYNSSTGVIAIGQAVETTSDVTFNDVTMTGELKGPSTFTIDPAGHGDNTGVVVIAGDLTVQGTTTTVNSNEVSIGDSVIVLNADEAGIPSQNGGIEIERGTSANVQFVWNEADDAWDLGNETLQNVVIDGGSY
jgi:hypothetical protein